MQYRWKMLIICGIFKFGLKAEQKKLIAVSV